MKVDEMTIDGDLRTDGDDAAELMEKYFQRFQVDAKDFDPQRYFRPEGTDPIPFSAWIRKLRGVTVQEKTDDITIGDLVDAARRGKWVDPTRQAK